MQNSSSSRLPGAIAIFISGRGSNMESIIKFVQSDYPKIKIRVVVSDKPNALGLKTAMKYGVEAVYLDPGKYKTKLEGEGEDRYINYLERQDIDFICLAGFMRILKPKLTGKYARRIINIHPSLLPEYPGLDTHARVLADGRETTGCTVHFVDEGVDTGETIFQKEVSVERGDTPRTLARRVIKAEYLAYKEALRLIFTGEIRLGFDD